MLYSIDKLYILSYAVTSFIVKKVSTPSADGSISNSTGTNVIPSLLNGDSELPSETILEKLKVLSNPAGLPFDTTKVPVTAPLSVPPKVSVCPQIPLAGSPYPIAKFASAASATLALPKSRLLISFFFCTPTD